MVVGSKARILYADSEGRIKIAEAFNEEALSDFENVDGIVSITHGTGCGINSKGLGWELLQATIAGYSRHPNFGGLIVIGLGCEVNQVSGMAQSMNWANSDTFKMMTIQDVGGTRKTIQEGVEMIKQMLPILNKNQMQIASNIFYYLRIKVPCVIC